MTGVQLSPTVVDDDLCRVFRNLGFVTCSRNMLSVLRHAQKAAEASDITVLLEGETGTGKQVIARGIHELDQKRAGLPFVTVHCGSISEALAESELFGHRRGAFSGAVSHRKGLFQAAYGGTLFLDDINDLPVSLQAKLLDVVQRGVVRPVGADNEVAVDVRIIAAANQPLEPLVRESRFRMDLYHRLNVVKLSLPPLRHRSEDLKDLILALAARYRHLYEPIEAIEPELLGLLESKPFPGNVRELENDVQRMLFLKSSGTSLDVSDWLAQAAPETRPTDADLLSEAASATWKAISQGGIPYTSALGEVEKKVLEAALNVPGSTRREVARRLHTSERTLYYKIRAHGLGHPSTA
jgi:transcriptional regulator with PAS, ATPase and Fis domain